MFISFYTDYTVTIGLSVSCDSTFPLLPLFLALSSAFHENSTRDGAAVDKAWKKFDGFDRWALPTAKVGPKFAKSSMTQGWNPRWTCFHKTSEIDLWMNSVFHPSCLKGVVKGRTRTDWSHFCQVCQVGWSGPHQGFQAHVERYRNSPVMHKSTLAFSWVPAFFPPPGAKNLRHQDVCYVFGGRLNITCFSASFGRTCCDPEVCQTVTSPWSSRTAFASLSLAQPRKSKLLWHHVGRKRMCNNVINSGH